MLAVDRLIVVLLNIHILKVGCYTECGILNVALPRDVVLSVVILNVVRLIVLASFH
jgi:hypothetical protein